MTISESLRAALSRSHRGWLPAIALSTTLGCSHSSHHHRFDQAAAWESHFEDPARDPWQKPNEVIAALELTPIMKVADIGAATGYFPVRIAAALPEGRVWGVDIEPDMVRFLNDRARREGLANLFAILAAPADPLLPEPVDRILVVNTYHHLPDRPGYLKNLRRYLAPGGRLMIVEPRPGAPVGPPEAHRLAPNQVREELTEAGFAVIAQQEFLPHQYILVASPSSPDLADQR